MDSSGSGKDEIWFLRVCHHVPHELYPCGPVETKKMLNHVERGVVISSPRVTRCFFRRHMLGKKLNDWEFWEIVCNFGAKDLVNGQKVIAL